MLSSLSFLFAALTHLVAVRVVQRAELSVELDIDCEIQIALFFVLRTKNSRVNQINSNQMSKLVDVLTLFFLFGVTPNTPLMISFLLHVKFSSK